MDSTPRTGSTRTGISSGLEGGLAQRAGKAGDRGELLSLASHLPYWQQVNALHSNDFDLKLEQGTMLATQ
jgi:hypothetical protein